jgi:glycosyltransferase involved in cell wall biosynthesis
VIRRLAVVVPAADEEETIGACVSALLRAARAVDVPVRVVVVLDGCTDGTAEEVARFPEVETVVAAVRCVGAVRAIGVEHALRDVDRLDECLLVSTDADSCVPPNWLAGLLALSVEADLVLGTVEPGVGLSPAVFRAWRVRHVLADGHPHVHAANLAIRADAYRQIGGWAPLSSGEDEDLAARAVAGRLRIARSGRLPVRTSTRAQGRAPYGFSSYLRALGHA